MKASEYRFSFQVLVAKKKARHSLNLLTHDWTRHSLMAEIYRSDKRTKPLAANSLIHHKANISNNKVSIDNFLFSRKFSENHFLYVPTIISTPFRWKISHCDSTSCSMIKTKQIITECLTVKCFLSLKLLIF